MSARLSAVIVAPEPDKSDDTILVQISHPGGKMRRNFAKGTKIKEIMGLFCELNEDAREGKDFEVRFGRPVRVLEEVDWEKTLGDVGIGHGENLSMRIIDN